MSLDEHDRVALTMALEQVRVVDADHAAQIAAMRKDGWRDAAEFAAYCCQIRALRLRVWQEPPSAASEDDPAERDKDAQQLLRRMLAAGVSRYDPDPLAAIAVAKRKREPVS